MSEVKYVWTADDVCDVYFDNELVIHLTTVDYGWDAMGAVTDAFTNLAGLKGWTVTTVDERN